jgi:hypothetical protein
VLLKCCYHTWSACSDISDEDDAFNSRMTEFVQIIAKWLGRAILSLQQPLELRPVRLLTELVTSTQKFEKIHCPTLHNTMKASTETADWAQSSLTCCFFLPLSFTNTLQLTFLNLCSSWSKNIGLPIHVPAGREVTRCEITWMCGTPSLPLQGGRLQTAAMKHQT